jgi:hypothetical protein
MAISEEARHEMYVRLEEVLGAQVAATVMEHLPPVGWADVATKRDLDAFQVAMTGDLEALRVATKRDLAAVEMRLRGELEALGMRVETLRLEMRSEFRGEINRLLLWLFPTQITLLGLVFAAAKLS